MIYYDNNQSYIKGGDNMAETPSEEQKSAGHEIILEAGTRAYPLPEFGRQSSRVGWRSIVPPTQKEAQQELNALLTSIDTQGGQLLGVIDVGVKVPPEQGVLSGDDSSEPKTFLIVKK